MQIITGIGESEHVTSMQHRAIFEMVIGNDSYILNKGELLEPELQSNNALKIRSGMLAHHGCISEVAPNTYDEVAIGNGSQSMKRIDLVVARYTQNAETKVERTEWTVIQGQPVESNPVAPDYIHGNMQDGDLTDDCPVFEVHLDGIQVVEIKKLLNVLDGSLAELNRKLVFLDQNAQNSSVNGWTLIRNGNIVTFKHNKVLSGVIAGHSYSNQGKIPEGYRPAIDITLPGDRIIGATITGSFYVSIGPAGNTNFVSDGNHNENQSYVASGAYITSDLFPLNDIPKVEI